MAENGNLWKSDYPKRHFYILGVAGLLLSIWIIVLEAIMLQHSHRDDPRLNDIRYNPMLPVSIAGIAFAIYFILLSTIPACAAKTKSRCLTITFLIMSVLAFALDVILVTFHGIHLISRCNPNAVNGITQNCRNEFDNVLLIMKHGSSLLMVIVASVLHGMVNLSSVIVSFYVLCHMEQKYLINGKHGAYN